MKANKQHYTLFSRFTHGRILKTLQKRGAKMHFNDVKVDTADYVKMLETEQSPFEEGVNKVHFRYGIIRITDLVRDLKYWETLMGSSMMQRPIKTIIDGDPEHHIWEAHQRNLKSAVAYAALQTKDGYEERDLY